MRATLLCALIAVAGGCGDSSMPSPTSVMSATFASLNGANTSGVAISSSYASCSDFVPLGNWSCSATELPMGQGRVVSVSFSAAPMPGADYALGGAENATLFFRDPTTFGTAMGDRQWQSVPGTGAIHVVDFVKNPPRFSFSYYGSMRALASPATGTFDIVGDGNITSLNDLGP